MTLASYGLGWQKSLPDFRDYTLESTEIGEMLARLSLSPTSDAAPPSRESLAAYFPQVDDQRLLNSSTAQACVDLVQYFERRSRGRTTRLSKLFVYQSTQKLLQARGSCSV